MVKKSQYYIEKNNLVREECVPTYNGMGQLITNTHTDAINAIADDDPGFLAWQVEQDAKQLDKDLQQATKSSAILIHEVFTILNNTGVFNAPELSTKAKAEFATLTALVNQYNG